jgi:hypothetical protein
MHRRQAAYVSGGESNSARGGLLFFEQFIGRLHLEGVRGGHGHEAAEERVDEQTVALGSRNVTPHKTLNPKP